MREPPIHHFWYGKGARYSSIEDLIDGNPSWFLWALEHFQDITPSQAKHFQDRYGMSLPQEYVEDIPPYVHTKDSPEKEYENLCKEYYKNH